MADLRNRTKTPELGSYTLKETLLGTIPDNSKVKIFGCATLSICIKKDRETSLREKQTEASSWKRTRAEPCVFV